MKKIILIILILIFNLGHSEASFKVSLLSTINSKKLIGEDPVTGDEGKLISNGNNFFGFELQYGFSPTWFVYASSMSTTYTFDNTDKIIVEGEEELSSQMTKFGIKWVIFSRTALRISSNTIEDIAFTVNSENKAVPQQEKLNFVSVYIDQILYMGGSYYIGVKLGMDAASSGDVIEERKATKYGALFSYNTGGYGVIEIFYEIINVTKKDTSLEYTETDTNLNLKYTVGF